MTNKKQARRTSVENADEIEARTDSEATENDVTDETKDTVVESETAAAGPESSSSETGAPEESAADTPSAGESTEEPSLEALKEQLEQARQEAARNLEGWQRAAAELANFKRRQEEQMKLVRDRIKADVLEGVISALDDLDLAFQNVPEGLDGKVLGWVEGFRLVQRKLNKILEDQNVMPIDTEGQFDPNFHEAVSHEESEEHEEGQIIAELRKGYQIGNRVLRPALVRVAK